MRNLEYSSRGHFLRSLEGKIDASFTYLPEKDAVKFERIIPMNELVNMEPEEQAECLKPKIPWFNNVKDAEDFCMTPIGDDCRLIDKAKKDFIRRSAKIRKIELLCWSGREGIR